MKIPVLSSVFVLAALAAMPALAQTTAPSAAGHAASQAASPDLAASIASDPFVKLDKNHDGVVTKDEADARLRKAWSKYDANHDGKVDSAEYAAGAN
ncbi:hypothetical protein [Solimonas soli]|uniref:hypothetical protein n=1 Tax=Solimonas soli TaxID=413479 RepID=UPI000484CB67|nr:hypothetical protein [Solimonas soli]